MESLLNHDAVLIRELYKKYKFEILDALSPDLYLNNYQMLRVLTYHLINYGVARHSSFKNGTPFSFLRMMDDDNYGVYLKTKSDLSLSNEYLNEIFIFFNTLFKNIDQEALTEVLEKVKKEYNNQIKERILEYADPIGTAHITFQVPICGSTKNFFEGIRYTSDQDILDKI